LDGGKGARGLGKFLVFLGGEKNEIGNNFEDRAPSKTEKKPP